MGCKRTHTVFAKCKAWSFWYCGLCFVIIVSGHKMLGEILDTPSYSKTVGVNKADTTTQA